MANAMVEARNEGRTYRRVEVITGGRRRQNWTADEKARIIVSGATTPPRNFLAEQRHSLAI